MLYVGAPVTALDVLVPLALTYFGAKSAAKTAELGRAGAVRQSGPGDRQCQPAGQPQRAQLVVLIDPTTQEYRIDWERSALVNGLVPAEVTLDEDNRTYDPSGRAGPLMEILQIPKVNHVAFAPSQSIGERLAELEGAATGGALTDQEYTDRRAQIISEI
jgi:hypothetical protein